MIKLISKHMMICGDTPLIKISKNIYAKLETYNPTGSVKDRMICFCLNRAIRGGLINSDTILCEATSGNTGIALSSVSARLGLQCVIFMPKNMSVERKMMMKAYGATFIDAPENDFEAAIKMRNEFIKNSKNAWSPMQFSNKDNIECHQAVTAPEIERQVSNIGESWGAFIHGSGTGGTIEGVRRYLKGERTKICMVVPEEEKHGIQGIGDGKDFLANPDDMDSVLTVKTQDAIDRAKRFSLETGILVGISSGANIVASERFASNNKVDGIIVTMLCDRGERYFSIYN